MGKRSPTSIDPREEPIYSVASAAWTLALPASTVQTWISGYRRGGSNVLPLIKPALRRPPTLSFWNLVEVYVLATIRREHGVPLQRIRKALRYVESRLGRERPLIEQEFLTNGVDLFVDEFARLINVSSGGQLALRDLLRGSLLRIDRDPRGLATRLYPWLQSPAEPRDVEIDPTRSFGRRLVAGTGVPTEILGERFRAGDSIDTIARDFQLEPRSVEAALRWEQCAGRR